MASRISGLATARTTGLVLLLGFAVGAFATTYPQSVLFVTGDATATAANIVAGKSLFRFGVVCFLVSSLLNTAQIYYFYRLMRPASPGLVLLAVMFQVISTTGFAMSQVSYYSVLPILSGADYLKTFSPDQLNSLALLSLRVSKFNKVLFELHFGAGFMLFGYIMFRSGFLPKLVGILLAIGGASFMCMALVAVLDLQLASFPFQMSFVVATTLVALWLLIKGVDETKWQESATAAGRQSP